MKRKRAIVLWTGGKDCNLALYEARETGLRIVALLTFAPEPAQFRAHPLPVMRTQAEALGLPHRVATVSKPYDAAYRQALVEACAVYDATVVVTGDIDAVDDLPNWVRQCCEGTEIEVMTPLWGRTREALVRRIINLGFEAVVSCIKAPLSCDRLGRLIDASMLEELLTLNETAGIDVSGKQGEYHTLVLDGPGYRRRLDLRIEGSGWQDGLAYIEVKDVRLESK